MATINSLYFLASLCTCACNERARTTVDDPPSAFAVSMLILVGGVLFAGCALWLSWAFSQQREEKEREERENKDN